MKASAMVVIAALALALSAAALAGGSDAGHEDQDRGEKIYMANCENCHLTGKNAIKPDKPIESSPKLASEETFRELLSRKNSLMPAFPDIANNDRDLHDLYAFVKKLQNQSWEYEPKAPSEPEPPGEHSRPKPPRG